MAIYKRPDSSFWWYEIYRKGLPVLRGSTGKTDVAEARAVEQIVKMAHSGKTPRDKLVAMIDALVGGPADGLPLAGVWESYVSWMTGANGAMEDSTRRGRRRAVERFVEWAAREWPSARAAGDVNRACAAGFARWLADSGAASKTRRNVVGDLGTVWEGLRRCRDDVTENPWPLVLPKATSVRLDAFTRDEERRVMRAADKAGWGLACRIARYTGLRYGDVALLEWKQVDLQVGVIELEPGKTARHGIAVSVPVCSALREALEQARKARGAWRAGAVEGKTGRAALRAKRCAGRWDGYVLPEHAKWYPKPSKGEMGAFSEVLKKAKVDGRHTFHSWRHTFRTRLSEAGVSDEIAKRLGGWTVDKTAMRYDHDGRIVELAAAVEAGANIGCQADEGAAGGEKSGGRRALTRRSKCNEATDR